MARKQLSDEEKIILETRVGPQLQKEEFALIPINGKNYKMSYCKIGNDNKDVIVLLPGFGSGWTGISLLGVELAKLGYRVFMPSLLGYGNSDNPPMYRYSDFLCEASWLHAWTSKVLPDKGIHWVGHSMASPIITELAAMSPDKVASLILLDPVGFQRRGMTELAVKFVTNGIGHAIDFAGDPRWEILKKFLPKEKSPFAKDRIKQRISEWKRLCNNGYVLIELRKVVKEKPARCIFGENDSLALVIDVDCDRFWYVPLPGLWHNTTMFGSEETAKAIGSFVTYVSHQDT